MWWKNTVIYEVYVDKFAGNFNGLTGKLDYLKNLGINCVWLLPHYPSPMVDDGYDVSDFYNVRPELGTLGDFQQFVKKAHEKGIRIIIDLVLNHVSIKHPWFKERRDFFLWSKTGREFNQAHNPFSHMTDSNWVYNPATEDYYFSSFFPEQADLNWDNPAIFNEFIKIIDFWAGLGVDPVRSNPPKADADMPLASRTSNGVDGFRLDAVAHLIKREGTNCLHLPEVHVVLKKLRRHLDHKWPGVILLAEASGSMEKIKGYFGSTHSIPQGSEPVESTSSLQVGNECHMAFNFPLMSSIYLAIKRSDTSIIDDMIEKSSGIPDTCQWATFIGNHDEITFTPLGQAERDEMIAWLDPGNKYSFKGGSGVSMRLATVFKRDKEKILSMFKTLFSLPGSPVIYYGSEIGMENIYDGDFTDTRKYVRGEFDWQEAERQMKESGSLLNQVSKIVKDRINIK
ncbi:MAG: alpha-amylase family glycosyl hydrolase [Candidatus Taylorbacteria bacterium]|nr:alpha-amylase family glycosyl hydrolase [Candidatus Taylorbacteria bacterium]